MHNQSIELSNQHFKAILHDNEANKQRSGSGFNPLTHIRYPEQNLFRDDGVGLNFEHIMNGAARDTDICMFTPRRDTCRVRKHSGSCASIVHDASNSSWNIDSEIRYRLSGEHSIDLEFWVTPREDRFPQGYVAFMWASYMNRTLDRKVYFWGEDRQHEGWIAFGEDTSDGFETGTVACHGVAHLPYEEGTQTLNIIEHRSKKFVLPFYYGLVHGSGCVDNPGDTMAYIMMFDQKESIRFAMWNFIKNAEGMPDTHSPAWDWQYLIQQPKVNETYGYGARVVYKPFVSRDDVLGEYQNWVRMIGQ